MAAPDTINVAQLSRLVGTPEAPVIVDVRIDTDYASDSRMLPASIRRDYRTVASWAQDYAGQSVAVVCQRGKKLSQGVAAWLRHAGARAENLEGGFEAWMKAGGLLVRPDHVPERDQQGRTVWVTRSRPKIDRVACPWLIRRLIDPQARILYVDPDQVLEAAKETGAIAFDIEGVELSHDGERCSFDTMLKLFGLEQEPTLARLALIVRGADTARPDLAPEAAGLHAISLGLSALAGDDDHGMIREAFKVYDGLFAYIRFAAQERHNWPAKAA